MAAVFSCCRCCFVGLVMLSLGESGAFLTSGQKRPEQRDLDLKGSGLTLRDGLCLGVMELFC